MARTREIIKIIVYMISRRYTAVSFVECVKMFVNMFVKYTFKKGFERREGDKCLHLFIYCTSVLGSA